MKHSDHLLVFTLDERKLALPLYSVHHVIRMVKILPVTDISFIFSGLVNIHGQLTPVLDIRKRLLLPPRKINTTDLIIIVNLSTQSIALVADSIVGVIDWRSADDSKADTILSGSEDYVEDIVKYKNEIIFVYNIGKLSSIEAESSFIGMERNRNDINKE